MSSIRRTISSRANGSLSRGPLTDEGKRRSSANGIRHGLLAKCVVLDDESEENFKALLAQHVSRFAPDDDVELGFIEEMAASFWRLRRLWAMETRMLNDGAAAHPEGDSLDHMTAAFSELSETQKYNLLHRYESRLHRMYQRCLRNLVLIRELGDPPEEEEPEIVELPGEPT